MKLKTSIAAGIACLAIGVPVAAPDPVHTRNGHLVALSPGPGSAPQILVHTVFNTESTALLVLRLSTIQPVFSAITARWVTRRSGICFPVGGKRLSD